MKRSNLLGFTALAALLLSGLATAQDAPTTSAPSANKSCIPLLQIRSTKVLDDENILIFTGSHTGYKSHLPQPCNGLTSANTFEYKTSQSELCSLDIITVLTHVGGGFMPGPSCGLGTFEPVDPRAVLKEFQAQKKAARAG